MICSPKQRPKSKPPDDFSTGVRRLTHYAAALASHRNSPQVAATPRKSPKVVAYSATTCITRAYDGHIVDASKSIYAGFDRSSAL